MTLFSAVILLSSFLLFQVEPMLGKILLPWFGGGAAVWTVCLLFFQCALVAGYGYAAIARGKPHAILLAASLLCLPLRPSPADLSGPSLGILLTLARTAGASYFLLSATSPLLQRWYTGGDPYRLYALSNFASLLALLTYPIFIEPWIPLRRQLDVWSGGYLGFAVLCAALAWAHRAAPRPVRPPLRFRASWFVLPACGSALLLATTNQMCQEVASLPFLWIAPLVLYLLSFIIVFDHPRWYQRRLYALLAAIAIPIACALYGTGGNLPLKAILAADAATLFVCLIILHGELAHAKPEPGLLGPFYLAIAIGGAIGGGMVALVCPRLFRSYAEFPLLLSATAMLALIAWYRSGDLSRLRDMPLLSRASVAGLVMAALIPFTVFDTGSRRVLAASRNFFGVLRVTEAADAPGPRRMLTHGATTHGTQFLDSERRRYPTAYYGRTSGIGLALQSIRNHTRRPLRVGVVGLGAGTLAAYGESGDLFRFYEINPAVISLARRYFTYLGDSAAQVNIVEGDARIRLREEAPQHFDLLAIDAFSSDSIPAHLLTAECSEIYRRHLAPDGRLLFHISNRSLNLEPVVRGLAGYLHCRSLRFDSAGDDALGTLSATWMELTPGKPPPVHSAVILWTDDFTSLWRLLK